ncbi:MAG TPA: DUF1700 domain-containing protein [Vicinamibacterales bacterium]|nr:DUF1700 domain-containing protein [Vicinamibacterales bacterium]
MTDTHPLVARYLAKLDAGLQALPAADRAEVVGEIRNHIAEAMSSGQPVDKVLASLGSADDLARGYAVELLLNRPPAVSPGMNRLRRFLALAGLIAIGSIPTFIVIVVLGSIGVSFVAAGVAVFVAGIAASADWLPAYVTMDVPPWVAVLVGPVMGILGGAALVGLVAYVRFTARLVRKVVPRFRPSTNSGRPEPAEGRGSEA